MRKIVIVAGLLLALSACSKEAPVAAPVLPAVSPSQTEEPAPVATEIVIGGTEFNIIFDDDSSETYAYASDPGKAISGLSAALGEPIVSAFPGDGMCDSSYDSSAWGGLILGVESFELPASQNFFLSARSDSPLPVPVISTNSLGVGDSIDEVFDATAEALRYRYDLSDGTVGTGLFFDMQSFEPPQPVDDGTDDTPPWGGYVRGSDGVVTEIVAPVMPAWDASC